MRELTGTTVAKWLDVELPKVQNLRLDLLGETVDGGLVHLELQSSNDVAMPFRMVEYCLVVHRLFEMQSKLRGPDLSFHYRLIDFRTLNGDRLPESE